MRVLLAVVAVVAAAVLAQQLWQGASVPSPSGAVEASGRATRPDGERAILEAYRARRSNVWVESAGVVEKALPDDRVGSRHQRFIVSLNGGQTLLVSHNLDVAPRVPVAEGDSVRFRGEYAWNAQGGVIHWTHHDPDGRMPGGWIQTGGRTYR